MAHMALRLMLVVLGWTLSGCATQSGQAVTHWVSRSLGRLREAVDPGKLAVPEIRRARTMMAHAANYPAWEAGRAPQLMRSAVHYADQVLERTQRLPGRGIAALEEGGTRMRRGVTHLTAPQGLLRRTLDPERHAAAARHICQRLPTVLGLDRPILPGPGDPDRQTTAHPTGPQETWLEKILTRVRL